jgi:hypothetical protein
MLPPAFCAPAGIADCAKTNPVTRKIGANLRAHTASVINGSLPFAASAFADRH